MREQSEAVEPRRSHFLLAKILTYATVILTTNARVEIRAIASTPPFRAGLVLMLECSCTVIV